MPTKTTEWTGHEFILLPNKGEKELELTCSSHVIQFLPWAGGDGEEVLSSAETALDQAQELLEQNQCRLSDGLVARLAAHAWTTRKDSEAVVVTDYRSGKESRSESLSKGGVLGIAQLAGAPVTGFCTKDELSYDEVEESTARKLGDTFYCFRRLDVGYHPLPCFRYHVKHNGAVVNLLSRGYTLRCYRTLYQGENGLERRFEFGFSVRDSVHPFLFRSLLEQAVAGPGVS